MTLPESRSSSGTPLDENEAVLYEHDRTARSTVWDSQAFSRTFRHEIARVSNGMRIHYVIGGHGPPLVLLHGFPQHWRGWRLVMPAIADAGYTVVAPDLRGFGESDKPLDGYDVQTVSEDIREVMHQLGQEEVYLAGHDAGASVAYAWAAARPAEVRRLVLMEAFPAGLEPPSASVPCCRERRHGIWPSAARRMFLKPCSRTAKESWSNICFAVPTIPRPSPDEEIDAYARPLAALGGIRGALAHIRAMPQSAAHNRSLSVYADQREAHRGVPNRRTSHA